MRHFHIWACPYLRATVLPDPEFLLLLVGAHGSGEVDVQGGSLLDSEVNAPEGVLARPVSTPRLVYPVPVLPEEEIVSGEVWPVCA